MVRLCAIIYIVCEFKGFKTILKCYNNNKALYLHVLYLSLKHLQNAYLTEEMFSYQVITCFFVLAEGRKSTSCHMFWGGGWYKENKLKLDLKF